MSAFEERLNVLERKVKSHDTMLARVNDKSILQGHSAPVTASSHRPVGSEHTVSFNQVAIQEEPQEDALTDGMAITFVSEDDSGFFGEWSHLCFSVVWA